MLGRQTHDNSNIAEKNAFYKSINRIHLISMSEVAKSVSAFKHALPIPGIVAVVHQFDLLLHLEAHVEDAGTRTR